MTACIHLPCLHRQSQQLEGLRLSPGLRHTEDGFWLSPLLPLAPEAAHGELDRLRAMGLDLIETMRHALQRNMQADANVLNAELAALADLRQDRDSHEEKIWRNILLQAQRILLWCWLQEEMAMEIGRLSSRINQDMAHLDHLFDDGSREQAKISALPHRDGDLFPPWRVCAANASFFIPQDMPIFVDGPMKDDLMERFDFRPLPAASPHSPGLLGTTEPLWRILGHTRPDVKLGGEAGARLKEVYSVKRRWLLRSMP